ncbi:cobalamin binding intrinsic factor-like [Centroberyx gerrardi]|uniref:cobalamin binding intrinsic factor-like n=1 Tax=Centroberyx gerrardi TaxID=166262 RepID=UPI003AAC6EEC
MVMRILLSVALLLLAPGILAGKYDRFPIYVMTMNSQLNTPNVTYSTYGVYRGILLGALKRLEDSNADFKFTYTEDLNYGPYLESVNGLAGNDQEHTYWELLVKTKEGQIIRPDVGIGCYIPKANEQIILKYTTW